VACSWRDISRASSSANSPAPASQTVWAVPKSRCCSSTVALSPGRLLTVPSEGLSWPSMRLKREVFPVPLRPRMPQRSPWATV